MPVYRPDADADRLKQVLADPARPLVACLCAAWCGTCREYEPKFDELSQRFGGHVFAWVDVEEHPDLIGDEDVENFPTLLIQQEGRTLFYGPMLPHIGHLERMLEALAGAPAADGDAAAGAPAVRKALAG